MIKKLRFIIDKFFDRINFTISTKKQKYPLGSKINRMTYIRNYGARTVPKGSFYWGLNAYWDKLKIKRVVRRE